MAPSLCWGGLGGPNWATVRAGQGPSTADLPQHPPGGYREELGADGVPRPPPQGVSPPCPQQGGSQRCAWPPAQGQLSWVPPSSFPPVGDGSDTAPYHPYFIFSRVFLACSTLTGEALDREQALLWLGWAKKQPQPHCVPLSVAHFHLLCSHEQLHGLCWVYLQWRERG